MEKFCYAAKHLSHRNRERRREDKQSSVICGFMFIRYKCSSLPPKYSSSSPPTHKMSGKLSHQSLSVCWSFLKCVIAFLFLILPVHPVNGIIHMNLQQWEVSKMNIHLKSFLFTLFSFLALPWLHLPVEDEQTLWCTNPLTESSSYCFTLLKPSPRIVIIFVTTCLVWLPYLTSSSMSTIVIFFTFP